MHGAGVFSATPHEPIGSHRLLWCLALHRPFYFSDIVHGADAVLHADGYCHGISCAVCNIGFYNNSVVSSLFGLTDKRCFMRGIGKFFKRKLGIQRILHAEICADDAIAVPFFCLSLGILLRFRKPIHTAFGVKHGEVLICPVIYHFRRAVLIHNLACILRMVLPIPEPPLKLLRLCGIHNFHVDFSSKLRIIGLEVIFF